MSQNSESDNISQQNNLNLEVGLTHKQKQVIRNKERDKRKRKLNAVQNKI